MSKTRRLLTQLVFALLIPTLAAIFFAGPASATRSSLATRSVAATQQARPKCGIKHYPPCPPPHRIHTGHRHKHPGQHFHIGCRHFAPHHKIHVRIFGHHRNRLLAVTMTDRHGNAEFHVTIPKHFKPGVYHMTIRVFGQKTKTIRFVVLKPKHHHHHH